AIEAAAERFGFASHTTRRQDAVEDPAIDVVDICTPGDTHHEVAIAALAAGTHVLCAKPPANSAPHTEEKTPPPTRGRPPAPRPPHGGRAPGAGSAPAAPRRWPTPASWSPRAPSARSGRSAPSTCRTGCPMRTPP